MDKSNYSAGIAQISRLIWNTYSKMPYKLAADPRYYETNIAVAAKFLKHNYEHYGTWKLALQAYNAGETVTDKVLAKLRKFNPITERYAAGVNY